MRLYHPLIDAWTPGNGAEIISVENPATEETGASVTCASRRDLEAAVERARSGLEMWGRTPAGRRSATLRRAAALLESKVDAHACTLTQETGKPLAESRDEWSRAIETLRWSADACAETFRQRPQAAHMTRTFVEPQPIGVAALITPWNYPAVVASRKLGSALAAGCSAIIKGSEECPGPVVELVEALYDAGIPRNVVSLVFGAPAEISTFLLGENDVKILSFTGSTQVGKILAQRAAAGLKRCVLELGGHCPVVVCRDADVDRAAVACAAYKFEHAGQSCNAPSRIYVHEDAYERFLRQFVRSAETLVLGNGFHPTTTMGPVSSRRRLAAIESLVEDAVGGGASVATGGHRVGNRGYFFAPTVLESVPPTARMMREEPFGPIVSIDSFREIDEAIALANGSPYGLASYVFSTATATARLIASRLRTGSVGINGLSGVAPCSAVGGIGESGLGYEGGRLGIDAFLNLKLVNDATRVARSPWENWLRA